MEFPTTNLYELESRVFTDHWSIPYKREESLGKCLIASTCLARHGKILSLCGGPLSSEGVHQIARSPYSFVGVACFILTVGCFSHVVILDNLMLHGSICAFVTAKFIFSSVWAWDKSSLSLSGLADADENCKRFIDRCMPEAFKKVSAKTSRWK